MNITANALADIAADDHEEKMEIRACEVQEEADQYSFFMDLYDEKVLT